MIEPINIRMPAPAKDSVFDLKSEKVNEHLFSGSIAATIPENPIIVAETKNVEQMKNLSTLGGLLMAGLVLDSTILSKDLSGRIKNHETVGVNNQQVTSNSGTFYASKLLWSETYKLYFLGDHVKVDLKKNKFIGSGKFSFLEKVHYLVIDHIPMKLNDAVQLTEKKYNLVELDEKDGAKKYGENGKFGVVEITLAE